MLFLVTKVQSKSRMTALSSQSFQLRFPIQATCEASALSPPLSELGQLFAQAFVHEQFHRFIMPAFGEPYAGWRR
jgi:hypothetical protein